MKISGAVHRAETLDLIAGAFLLGNDATFRRLGILLSKEIAAISTRIKLRGVIVGVAAGSEGPILLFDCATGRGFNVLLIQESALVADVELSRIIVASASGNSAGFLEAAIRLDSLARATRSIAFDLPNLDEDALFLWAREVAQSLYCSVVLALSLCDLQPD